ARRWHPRERTQNAMTAQQVVQALQREDLTIAGSPMDSEEFAAFYERSARPLWAYLARVSGDPALADDLMQESFVRFLCAAAPEDGDGNSRRYLFRIASNLLRDHWRRPKAASIDDLPEEIFATLDASGQFDSWS